MVSFETEHYDEWNEVTVLDLFNQPVDEKQRDVFLVSLTEEMRDEFGRLESNMRDSVVIIASLERERRRSLGEYIENRLAQDPHHHGPPGFLETKMALDHWEQFTGRHEWQHAA